MWGNDGMGWGGWLLMVVAMVGFWALVVLGIAALFRGSRQASGSAPRSQRQTAEAILRERFARGEVSVEDYHARQQVLASAREKV